MATLTYSTTPSINSIIFTTLNCTDKLSPMTYSLKFSVNSFIGSSMANVPVFHHNTPILRFRSSTATLTGPSPVPKSIRPKPIRPIPGDYGPPIVGPIKDRFDYFYNQGKDEFFRSRMKKYESTVFRVNMPPGPPISGDSRVIVLLDGKSFPVLFDTAKVDKKDVLTGTFTPSTNLTGGHRMLAYLDPSEPNHEKLKQLAFFLLKSTHHRVIPEFHATYSELFDSLESELATKEKAEFMGPSSLAAFNFLARAWFGVDPTRNEIGFDAPKIIAIWLFFKLSPILTLKLPKFLELLTIHTFRLPSTLIKVYYNKLYEFVYENSSSFLEEAERIGISRDEACHNLLFITCFNNFGGMNFLFPNIIKRIGMAGKKLHGDLATEIRSAMRSGDGSGKATMAAIERMPLVKSVVYEVLRIAPPIQMQYGRAKDDFVVESHDAAFEVKKGELLLGFQPFATKDPMIFDRPEEFVPDRFVGEDGERLLRHLVWSNGPETETPSVHNKQCAGKDFVVLVSRLLVVEMFLRYDSFEIDVKDSALGPNITVTKLEKATY